tara:strand:+ start:282 stop:923 length:642 start_codon:yes stop_codon:yes gene_type:complete
MVKSEEIFDKDDDKPDSPEPEKPKKPKRKLTEKQLANLAKGRAKMAEKRRLKNAGLKEEKEKKKKEEKQKKEIVKEEKKAVKDIKKEKKEQKAIRNRLLKEQAREEEYFKELKAREIEELKNNQLSEFQQLRTRYLLNCKTSKEYAELKEHLDTIDEETVLDRTKLRGALLNMISKYTKPKLVHDKQEKQREKIDIEEDNLKIDIDVKGLKKN